MKQTDDSVVAAVRSRCGDAVADLLLANFGGEKLHVPMSWQPESRLGRVFSPEQFAALVDAVGGEQIEVPLGDRSLSRKRLATVKAMLRRGASVNEIVREAVVSRRYVFKIKAQLKAERREARSGADA